MAAVDMAGYRHEIKKVSHIAVPLIASLLAQMGMEFVDVLMLSRLGAPALAGGSLGGITAVTMAVIGIGLLSIVGAWTANALGEKKYDEAAGVVANGVWLSIFYSIPALLLLWFVPTFLAHIGQDPLVVESSSQFIRGMMWGVLPVMIFVVMREYVSAMERSRIIMIITVFMIPCNAALNYILMYGKFGFPELHIMGVGLATALIDIISLAVLLTYIYLSPSFSKVNVFSSFLKRRIQWQGIKKLFLNGWPVGVTRGLEIGLFVVAAMMMGWVSMTALAAHNLAMQWTSVAFMFPLGLSQAAAIRVAYNIGEGSFRRARLAAIAALSVGLFCAIFTILFLVYGALPTVDLYLGQAIAHREEVLSLAGKFFLLAALFQFFDVAQVMFNGALRGMKDTVIPMWLGMVSYWLVGIGSGYWLAFRMEMNGSGVWWGLVLGIAASGVLLAWRFFYLMNKEIKREENV